MATQVKIGDNVVFGLTDLTAPTTFGTVVSCDIGDEAQVFEDQDGDGDTKTVIWYDFTRGGTLEIIAKPTQAAPYVGDPMTINAVIFRVMKVSTKWARKDSKKFSVEVKKWDAIADTGV